MKNAIKIISLFIFLFAFFVLGVLLAKAEDSAVYSPEENTMYYKESSEMLSPKTGYSFKELEKILDESVTALGIICCAGCFIMWTYIMIKELYRKIKHRSNKNRRGKRTKIHPVDDIW